MSDIEEAEAGADSDELEAKTDLENDHSIGQEEEESEEVLDDATPLKDRKLQTNPFDFVVVAINAQIEDESIVLQDEFQRRRVWNDVKSSRLIESLILNVPIPVCYFAEIESGSYAVVDGQQRLTAIYRYLNNQYPLRGLKVRPDLNKKRFFELNTAEQRLIKNRTIRCIVILKESHPEIRFDVFERLNTATVSLNRQELRNSTYRGALNSALVRLCDHPRLLEIRNAKTPDKRMRDAELILRFFAFHFGAAGYKGRFTSHLDTYLSDGRELADNEIATHEAAFADTIEKVYSVFGDRAFRRVDVNGEAESQINSAIYDALMLTFAQLGWDAISGREDAIRAAFINVCSGDAAFVDAVSRATRDRARLNTRLARWAAALNAVNVPCPAISFGQAPHAIPSA